MDSLPRLIQFLLANLTRLVRVNDLSAIPTKLCWILLPQPCCNVVRFGSLIHHHKQDRLPLQRFQLLPVFSPSLDSGGQIPAIADARVIGLSFDNACDAFHWALDDVVQYRLLQWVVRNRPRENRALREPWSRREIQLGRNRCLRVQGPNGLVPLAVLVVRVVCLVIQDSEMPSPQRYAVSEVSQFQLSRRRLGPEYRRHLVRLIIRVAVSAFVELLDVRQKEHALRRSLFRVSPHHTVKLPEDFEFTRDDR